MPSILRYRQQSHTVRINTRALHSDSANNVEPLRETPRNNQILNPICSRNKQTYTTPKYEVCSHFRHAEEIAPLLLVCFPKFIKFTLMWNFKYCTSIKFNDRSLLWNYTGLAFLKETVSWSVAGSQSRLEETKSEEGATSITGWRPGLTVIQVLRSITWEATWLAPVLCWQGSFLQCASRTTCKPGVLMTTLIKNQTDNFQTIATESQICKKHNAHSLFAHIHIPGPNSLPRPPPPRKF